MKTDPAKELGPIVGGTPVVQDCEAVGEGHELYVTGSSCVKDEDGSDGWWWCEGSVCVRVHGEVTEHLECLG